MHINIKLKRTGSLRQMTKLGIIVLAISTVGVKAQDANPTQKIAPLDVDCVKVVLTSNSKKLEKRNPIHLRVRIDNLCGHKIQASEPSFTIDKSIINERRFGDSRVGRIIRNSKIDNTTKSIDPGKYLEFALDTNELRWMDSMSSIEVFEDLFTGHKIETGSYQLYGDVEVCPSCKLGYRSVTSNKIEVLFEKKATKKRSASLTTPAYASRPY